MTKQSLPTANMFKRLIAMIYDSLIIMAVAMAYGAFYLSVKHAIFDIELATDERATIGTPGFVGLILTLEVFLWFFWCRGGQTLGMRAWRLQLVQDNGQTPNLLQAMIRGLIAPFSLLPFGLGFLWGFWDKNNRTWHDHASGTWVVQLEKNGSK